MLLVHPGGPFWARRDDGAWSIPKGEYDDGEDPEQAARREFEEELGSALPAQADLRPLGEVRQKSGKRGPWSTRTSTRSIPRPWDHATPATGVGPAATRANERGTSIRELVLIGACSAYPRGVQYASKSRNRLTSRSTSHLVAET